MQTEWLIIDGYNLLHQVPELARLLQTDLHLARHRLVRMTEKTAHRMAPQTTIVFDGRESGRDDALSSSHLEIYYSSGKHTADTVIEQLVARFASPEKILVVTSDRAEADTVLGDGAQVMSSQEFMAQCEIDSRKPASRHIRPGGKSKLGDHFPEGL
ncbi:MAG: NYN domain-containing protein [Pontiella sp.]|nr:NYN domain-containing protein [Pontiella sp.]